jgi:hypothetical protein
MSPAIEIQKVEIGEGWRVALKFSLLRKKRKRLRWQNSRKCHRVR